MASLVSRLRKAKNSRGSNNYLQKYGEYLVKINKAERGNATRKFNSSGEPAEILPIELTVLKVVTELPDHRATSEARRKAAKDFLAENDIPESAEAIDEIIGEFADIQVMAAPHRVGESATHFLMEHAEYDYIYDNAFKNVLEEVGVATGIYDPAEEEALADEATDAEDAYDEAKKAYDDAAEEDEEALLVAMKEAKVAFQEAQSNYEEYTSAVVDELFGSAQKCRGAVVVVTVENPPYTPKNGKNKGKTMFYTNTTYRQILPGEDLSEGNDD